MASAATAETPAKRDLHPFAGCLAGALFAIALYRRGRIADAILAHATANGLIAIYVLMTGKLYLWS